MTRNAFAALAVLALAATLAAGAEKWTGYTTQQGLPNDAVQFIEQDADGTLWAGTEQGGARFVGGKFVPIADEKGKPMGHRVWDVLRAGANKHYLGTSGGVYLLEGDKVSLVQRGNVAQILAVDGKLVAKVNDDVMLFDGKEWKTVEYFKGKRPEILAQMSDGRIWVIVEADGAYAWDPRTDKEPDQHLRGTSVKVLREDKDKRIWAGLWGKGVMVLEDGTWNRHLKHEKSYILDIEQDAKGNIWVATSAHGLYRYDGTDWAQDLADEGAINMLEVTSDGRVWISTQMQGGLRYWDGKQWQVSLDSVLPMRCMLETKSGEIWAAGVLDGVHLKAK